MEIFYVALKTTFPLLFTMAIGYAAKKTGVFGKEEVSAINKIVYWIFLPILLFSSVYKPELYTLQNVKLLIFSVTATGIVIIASFLLVPFFIKDRRKIGVVIQALIRGNVLYFGIPVIVTLLGDTMVGLMSIVLVALVPMYNVFGVIALGKYTSVDSDLKELGRQLVRNPLIIAVLVGILGIALGVKVPELVMQPLVKVSKAATPTALILLGAAVELSFTKESLRVMCSTVVLKLAVIPLLVVSSAIMLGFLSDEVVTVFAVFATPTSVASYSLAREMGGDYDLAGQIVFLSTIASIATIFGGAVVLQWLEIL